MQMSHEAPRMELDEYLAELESNAILLAAAARQAGPDTAVTTCPDWCVRELVLHTGEVHRWATSIVRNAVTDPRTGIDADYLGPLPTDNDLLEWFVGGVTVLISTLRHADPDTHYFTFLEDPPSPLMFWARRQTLETAMHRIDAESASGCNTGMSSKLAAAGIDELLTGFAPRKRTPLHSTNPVVLQIAPADTDSAWRITITDEPAVTVRSAGEADCSVNGLSSDIYQALWNRQGVENLTINGRAEVLALFRDNVKIRWS